VTTMALFAHGRLLQNEDEVELPPEPIQ